MQTYRVKLHDNGPALWPEHKPAEQVLELQATTPEDTWETTYQGNPTPPGGSVFRRAWWIGQCRYDPADRGLINSCMGRWMSWDTGLKDKETSAYSACCVAELWPDYRLALRYVYRDRLEFPALPAEMERLARKFNRDEKLRGILIEDKASGTSAYQTLSASAPDWLKPLLVAFMPIGDKITRAKQAAVWCKNACVQLPHPAANENEMAWLLDFEDELFDFPNSAFMDQVDAFSQLIIYVENLLAEGWRARRSTG